MTLNFTQGGGVTGKIHFKCLRRRGDTVVVQVRVIKRALSYPGLLLFNVRGVENQGDKVWPLRFVRSLTAVLSGRIKNARFSYIEGLHMSVTNGGGHFWLFLSALGKESEMVRVENPRATVCSPMLDRGWATGAMYISKDSLASLISYLSETMTKGFNSWLKEKTREKIQAIGQD
jgi:hypothetical protein